MKKNKGVTLVALIMTIITLIILALITIFYGMKDTTQKAIKTKNVYEVFSILDAVTNRTLMHRLNGEYYKFVGDNSFGTMTIDQKQYSSSDGWYLINSVDQLTDLGLDSIVGDYLINYEKGLAVSTTGITYEGKIYYSLNELKKEMGGGSTLLAQVEYDDVKKVNRPVLSNGMVPVKAYGSGWVVASTDDETWYDYSKDQMAWANVMLKDELTVEGYTNEQVRNVPISELVGKEVITPGSAYVWIPRYTAKSIGETGSEILFSNLTDDKATDGYTLPEAFNFVDGDNEVIKLPGIWVSKYEASFDR